MRRARALTCRADTPRRGVAVVRDVATSHQEAYAARG
jgi:hypothetical protein